MAYEHQEYPKYLYHPTEAPKGRVFKSELETVGLAELGWVDTPAKFPASVFGERLDQLSPSELEAFVADVVAAGQTFARVLREQRIGGLRADIAAYNQGVPKPVAVFEVKKVSLAGADLVHMVKKQQSKYEFLTPGAKFVLAVSGRFSDEAAEVARKAGLTIWDGQDLFRMTTAEVGQRWNLPAGTLAPSFAVSDKAHELSAALSSILPGDTGWVDYQVWVADVFEYLFLPPLGPAHYEDSDDARRNRRDLIIENWASDGFWAQIRDRYSAEHVVVDAKNHTNGIKKRDVVSLAHYLKPYGVGLFGMLISRTKPMRSAVHARNQEWIGARKMILLLDDDSMVEMIRLKSTDGRPEEVLRRQIAVMRKGL